MFHSRFSLKDRLEIEKRVLKRFGKYSNDSDRRGQVLVASQVVEQSLDLDFDVMISDLAPIDLLIQRAGRLHRHSYRNKRTEPIFYIHSPKDTDTPTANWFSDDFISASYVYKDSAMLWRTKEILKQQKCIRMPEDARLLIESVYGENSIEIPDVFIQSEDNAWAEDMCKKSIASFNNLSFEQGYSRMSNDANKWDSEEKVSTRLSDNNNKLILCRWIDGKIIPIHKKDNFSWDLSALILRSSSLSSIQYPQDITSVIEELQKQKRFKYNTLFVVFQNEELKLVGKNANEKEVIIEYNSKTGLTINKSKEERS